MHITIGINVSATTCAALVLMDTANAKSVISQVATNKYLKSSKLFGINFMSTNKHFIADGEQSTGILWSKVCF